MNFLLSLSLYLSIYLSIGYLSWPFLLTSSCLPKSRFGKQFCKIISKHFQKDNLRTRILLNKVICQTFLNISAKLLQLHSTIKRETSPCICDKIMYCSMNSKYQSNNAVHKVSLFKQLATQITYIFCSSVDPFKKGIYNYKQAPIMTSIWAAYHCQKYILEVKNKAENPNIFTTFTWSNSMRLILVLETENPWQV